MLFRSSQKWGSEAQLPIVTHVTPTEAGTFRHEKYCRGDDVKATIPLGKESEDESAIGSETGSSPAHHSDATWEHYHAVLGHLSYTNINHLINSKSIQGLPLTPFMRPRYACYGCNMGNKRKNALPRQEVNRQAVAHLPHEVYEIGRAHVRTPVTL